ncbi:hypothetical protein GE061_013170 [Apolygus lucorum]|uniref:Sulfotransferase domain-containing protein n=1 Tax=Apolygus lucorum TaxID=248454 RepID=A0A6A4JYH7_APOLU|nr:hypothetical protein GE061_013170 [Apolygus lucorum]
MRYMRLRDSSVAHGRKRKASAIAIGVISILCLISFLISQNFVTTLPSTPAFFGVGRSIQSLSSNELVEAVNITADIEYVLQTQRKNITKALQRYRFPNGQYNISARNLDELVLEKSGRPIRSIIVTTWRSGSTFLGDILDSVPGNFYHYEPLLHRGIVQIRGPPHSRSAIDHLKHLMTCNYDVADEDMDNYLSYGVDHKELFAHNRRLWEKCVAYPHLCYHPQFLKKFCSLFPFQSMKIVRVRLNLIEKLLLDPSLGIKVLFVVRDPRGTMQSRKHRGWCPGNKDCWDSRVLCADLTADFSAALRLKKKFPDTFRAVRYEDISVNPYEGAKKILRFFGREFVPEVRRFLDTHTVHNIGGVSSTYRNSKSAPFHWRGDLTHGEVRYIQESCKTAMAAWGYVSAMNATHQKTFDPIKGHFALE